MDPKNFDGFAADEPDCLPVDADLDRDRVQADQSVGLDGDRHRHSLVQVQ